MTPLRLLLLLCLVCSVSLPAFAEEISDVEGRNVDALSLAERAAPARWEGALQADRVGRSKVEETGGNAAMAEIKASLARKVEVGRRVELKTGFHYTLRGIDAPAAARLPETLHSVALDLGGEYRVDRDLSLGAKVSPGVSSDFNGLSSNDFRIPVVLHALYHPSQHWLLVGGIAYTGLDRSFPVLPVIGASYFPSERWVFAVGFPRTGIIYKPTARIDTFAAFEFSGGEYRLHDPALGANIISYRERRVAAGADLALFSGFRLEIAGGAAFHRKFVFYEGDRSEINLEHGPFLRLAMKYGW